MKPSSTLRDSMRFLKNGFELTFKSISSRLSLTSFFSDLFSTTQDHHLFRDRYTLASGDKYEVAMSLIVIGIAIIIVYRIYPKKLQANRFTVGGTRRRRDSVVWGIAFIIFGISVILFG